MSDATILGQVALGYSPFIDRNRAVSATRLTVFPLRTDAAVVGQVDDRVLEAMQHLARQFLQGATLEQQGAAVGVQRDQRIDIGRVGRHEGRHLDHQVGRGLGQHQLLQQAFAGQVERDPRAGGRPDIADLVQELADVEHRVGPQREHRQAGGGDRTIAVDERRIAERHLTENRGIAHVGSPFAVSSGISRSGI